MQKNPNQAPSKKQEQETDIFAVLSKGVQPVINEKLKRCRDFRQGHDSHVPYCYKQNSPKQELVLENVIQFRRQFQIYYDQRELFLYPRNECDIYKFICTTIRPTKLGFLELYTYAQCAERISSYVSYETLDPPNEFPQIIPSPTNVARWQQGDCFDMSILLCSLLIGVGYDAYCVYGKAPREITTQNEAQMECLYLDKGEYKPEDESKGQTKDEKNQFTIVQKSQVQSKFDKMMRDEEARREAARRKKASTIDDDQPDDLADDEYMGQRIHCWVLVKNDKRELNQNKSSQFIEPSTGRIYELENSPYESVEAVFNNRNFWINMNPELPVKDVSFKDMDTSLNWEYVMLDTMNFGTGNANDDDANNDEENNQNNNRKDKDRDMEQENLRDIAQILDMPPPWAPKIIIDREQFLRGSPLGETTVFYKRCQVDNYSPYSQTDGLIQKITLYEDYKRLKIREIRYFYYQRSDFLSIRRRYPYEFLTIDEYNPCKYDANHVQQWRQVIEIDRRSRIIKYYPNRNHDGLIKRVELIGEKTIEYYLNRDDRLIYRSVRFDPNRKQTSAKEYAFKENHTEDSVYITQMTVQYQQNRFTQNKNELIHKMIIDMLQQKITVIYHLNDGEIYPIVEQEQRAKILGFGKQTDNGAEKNQEDPIQQKQQQHWLNLEKECYQGIKFQEESAQDNYKAMKETKITLEKTIFDKARDRFKENNKKSEDDQAQRKEKEDYLYPFLLQQGLVGEKNLNLSDAMRIKNEVMKKLQERLLSRAEIIQQRLDAERTKYDTLNQDYSKQTDIDKDMEVQMENLDFKINILEQRALQFESMALEQYEQMDRQLNEDPRLGVLQKQ